jgi:hypothetical protein
LYEQNLEVQERTVTTRQEHETVYDADPKMVRRWQETHDKHPGEITWVERNIYLSKQRNLGRATGEFGDFLTPGWISRPSVRGGGRWLSTLNVEIVHRCDVSEYLPGPKAFLV